MNFKRKRTRKNIENKREMKRSICNWEYGRATAKETILRKEFKKIKRLFGVYSPSYFLIY